MTRARAHRSEDAILVAASSDEELMDTGMKSTGDSDDGFPATLRRGRGRARGRARGARGQNSTVRGSSQRGRGKKSFTFFVLQFLTFFFKNYSLLMLPSGGNLLLKDSFWKNSSQIFLVYYMQLTVLQCLSCDFFTGWSKEKYLASQLWKHNRLLKDALLGRSVQWSAWVNLYYCYR